MKKYRVGIIGIGNIGKVHIESLRKLDIVDVVSVCSRTNVERRAQELNIHKAYTDYEAMILNENLDVVHICTTNDQHYPMAAFAMMHGVHVVLEKPMTLTHEEAIKLNQLAIKHNVVNEVHFHNRFYPINFLVKSKVHEIGDIVSISGAYLQDWMIPKDQYNWRADSKASGLTRVIADVGTHFFDLVEYVTGHKIIEVSSKFKQIYDERNHIVIDTEDIGVIIFKTDKNAIGTCLISQSVAGKKNEVSYLLSGKKASLSSNGHSIHEALIGYYDKENEIIKSNQIDTLKNGQLFEVNGFHDSFTECFRQFYYTLDNRMFNYDFADFKDGLHSMKLVDAIYLSNKEERWVKVDG